MRRGVLCALAAVCLTACPSTARNPCSEAGYECVDASAPRDVPDGDVRDGDDAEDSLPVRMVIDFGGVALSGQSADGVVRMRANVTWNRVPRKF